MQIRILAFAVLVVAFLCPSLSKGDVDPAAPMIFGSPMAETVALRGSGDGRLAGFLGDDLMFESKRSAGWSQTWFNGGVAADTLALRPSPLLASNTVLQVPVATVRLDASQGRFWVELESATRHLGRRITFKKVTCGNYVTIRAAKDLFNHEQETIDGEPSVRLEAQWSSLTIEGAPTTPGAASAQWIVVERM